MPLFGPNMKKMREKGDTHGLVKALQHSDMNRRVEAVKALAALTHTRGLLDALRNDYPPVCLEAISALVASGRSNDPSVVNALMRTLVTTRNDGIWRAAFATLAESQGVNEEMWHKLAAELIDNKRYQAALKCFDKIVEKDNSKPTLQRIASILMQHGRIEDALKYGDLLTNIAANDASVWEAKANVLYVLDRYDDAMTSIQRALEIDPTLETARDTLINIYHAMGDYAAVASIATETLEASPDNILARIMLSDCLKALGKLADAESQANAALESAYGQEYFEPEVLGLIHSKLGVLGAMRGRKEQALAALAKAVEADSKDEYYRELLDSYKILDAAGLALSGAPEDRERRVIKLSKTRLRAREGKGLSVPELTLSDALRDPPAEYAWRWTEDSWLHSGIQGFMLKVWPVEYFATAIEILESSGERRVLDGFRQGLERRLDQMAG